MEQAIEEIERIKFTLLQALLVCKAFPEGLTPFGLPTIGLPPIGLPLIGLPPFGLRGQLDYPQLDYPQLGVVQICDHLYLFGPIGGLSNWGLVQMGVVQIGVACISSKFGHQMEPHALVANSATRWHHLH